jgi:hypothetical protein
MRLFLLASLFAATTHAAPVRIEPKDIIGDWVSLQRCSVSLWKFGRDGKYFGRCFDSIESGRWAVRGEDKIDITYYDDPARETTSAKSEHNIITITGFEPHSDRTFIYVRYRDGRRDKWMK